MIAFLYSLVNINIKDNVVLKISMSIINLHRTRVHGTFWYLSSKVKDVKLHVTVTT